MLRGKFLHLPEEVGRKILSILQESGIFSWSLEDLRPADLPVRHSFELSTHVPIHCRSSLLPPRHNDMIRSELDNMLKAAIITPASSAWSFFVVIATKKGRSPCSVWTTAPWIEWLNPTDGRCPRFKRSLITFWIVCTLRLLTSSRDTGKSGWARIGKRIRSFCAAL